MKRKLFLSILIAGSSYAVQAVPTFTSYSGTLSNGATIFISGAGMGTKAKASPLKWEDLEAGVFNSTWTSTNDMVTSSITSTASEQRWTGSSKNFSVNWVNNIVNLYFTETNTVYPKWYCQYWVKISSDWNFGNGQFGDPNQFLSNIKFFRMWNPGSTQENWVVALQGWTSQVIDIAENIPGENTNYIVNNFVNQFAAGKWHLFQFEFADNSALDAADGVFRMWIDGIVVGERTNIVTRHLDNVYKRPFILGWYNSWPAGSGGDYNPNHIWFDDYIVDNNWTRLELSTCTTFSTQGCMREYQPLVAVSDSSSSFRFNQGQLTNGSTVYAWWTDSNGARNSSGLKMVVGNTGQGASGGGLTNLNPSISNITNTSMTATFTNIGGSTQYSVAFSTDNQFLVTMSSGVISSATTGYVNLSPTTLYNFEVKNSTDSDDKYAVTSGMTTGGAFNPQGGIQGFGTFSGFGSAYFK